MAAAVVGGAILGDAVSKLSSLIMKEINKSRHFKSQLKQMQETVDSMRPLAEQLDKLNQELDRPKEETEGFINLLDQADELVQICAEIKWNIWKRSTHASKLEKMNKSLRDFVQVNLQLQNARTGAETLVEVKSLKKESQKGSSRGGSSGVPLQKGVVIGFDDRVKDLKVKLIKDCPKDDCSIVVVSGTGGSGKTTFVKLFCNDPDIREKFGPHIYFVAVSQNYNPKVIVTKLLGELPTDTNNEDAIQQWERFLGKNQSEILLVLDDVWSDEVIEDFKFKLPRYKILVTSRITFRRLKTYELQVLNSKDATQLFRSFALPENSNVLNDLVEKMVKCCKNHPLLLSVIGGMLNGASLGRWEFILKELAEAKKPFLDMNETILECLKKSLYLLDKEPELKQFYLHLGLFPEDQKIASAALMDMWVHLYDHDEEGLHTMNILDKLSSRNLATLLQMHAIVNRCEEEFVTQHDMMRELAIRSSSKEPVKDRETLIINAYGHNFPKLPQTVNACVLSISTDERFPSTWNEIEAPKVEVFVLNYMSEIHPLPQFRHNMKSLKVLIITNYGYNFSEIQNFPTPDCLSGLTRIRLDHVSISSISETILMLENLQKLSFVMCKIGDSFNQGISNKMTNLLEINFDSCEDLVTFPSVLCNSARLKKLSITNCHELTSVSELGTLSNLEVLQVASCSNLTTLPKEMKNLKKLKIIDISYCTYIHELPQDIGELRSTLQTINATRCASLQNLPESVENFDKIDLVCDEETSHQLSDFKNVKVKVITEDPFDTFFKINPRGH
ncbi:hypothetical protein E3N88_28161 [Mikania micrantha]|uniref:RPW8 domain-containing protein n=1 Tax=Mikania micrantha TaxID=192012 RepID=A0A5N6MZV5_9ASTR|nr:hypothetical protein E3N88_28161 [Mikania micrantha]